MINLDSVAAAFAASMTPEQSQEMKAWVEATVERLDVTYLHPLLLAGRDVPRECGACTLCCTQMAVAEIGKPEWTTCSLACATGCAIYRDRPSSCRAWSCAWKQGMFSEDARPDKTGVLVTVKVVDGPQGEHTLIVGGNPVWMVLVADTTEANLIGLVLAMYLCRLRGGCVAEVHSRGRGAMATMFGPTELLAQYGGRR